MINGSDVLISTVVFKQNQLIEPLLFFISDYNTLERFLGGSRHFIVLSRVVPHCLSLLCAHAVVILLVVSLWFPVHAARRRLSLRLTGGQIALSFVLFLAYRVNGGTDLV